MPRELLVDRVYSHLLTRLAAREIPVGAHLNAQRIAEELDVSRTSVKLAIARLIDEGWVAPDGVRRPIVRQHPPRRKTKTAANFEFQNQTERTYEALLERIQRGELRVGEVLKARRLARELHVNPVTVQRAAEWLRSIGLLERQRRRGWRVVNLLMNDLHEVYELRIALESRVLRGVVGRIEGETLDALEAECDRIIALGEEASMYERRQADLNLHFTLARNCGSRVLCETLEPLIRRAILFTTVGFRFSRVALSFGEHKAILQAIRHGDEKGASAAMESHLRFAAAHSIEAWTQAERENKRVDEPLLAKTD